MTGIDEETTGDARVDAALARFAELAGVTLAAHPEIFEDVHRRLQDALTGIERGVHEGAEVPRPREAEPYHHDGSSGRSETGPGRHGAVASPERGGQGRPEAAVEP